MLLPLVVDLEESDRLAESSCDLLSFRFISLHKVDRKVESLASVRYRNIDISARGCLRVLLVHFLDERHRPLGHGIHTALVCLQHVVLEGLCQRLCIGAVVEVLIEARLDRKRHHHILCELFV